jgi:hypothetical protein
MFDIVMALVFIVLISARCMVSLSVRSPQSPNLNSRDIDG